jgi:uncharacterized protein (DUF697 family)
MLNDAFERNGSPGWSNWWSGFDWEGARQGVDRESRARILMLGMANAGKSTLFNRLHGWTVSPPAPNPSDGLAAGDGHLGRVEDFGLFCLLDLPPEAGDHPNVLNPFDLAGEADLLVYVLDGAVGVTACDYRWIGRLRRLGRPLVVVFNKSDLAGDETVRRLPEIEERLATSVLPVSALNGTNVMDKLLPRMVDVCPALAVPLGRELHTFRRQAANRLMRRMALFNGLIALEPVPLLDIPLQLITQVGLVLRIGAIYGYPPTDVHRHEVIAAIAGGLAGRYAAQQLAKLVPVAGWLVSGLIGASCTWLLGGAAMAYFETGGDAALLDQWAGARASLRRSWLPVQDAWRALAAAPGHLRRGARRRWASLPRLQVGWAYPTSGDPPDDDPPEEEQP